jgi:MATE family multidrug resistance protein
MVVAAFFQVFDGAQVIALGALRGLQDTRVPMWIAGTSYWLIGFPAAWLLGFTLGGGPPGIWWGLALGLLVVAIALSIRFERMSTHVIAVSGAAAASA